MSEWVVCPACRLRHSRRPSGACPRCGAALEGGELTPPATPATPAPAAALPSLAAPAGLGRLAQSARSKQLRSARGIMIFVGVMTVVMNAVFYGLVEGQVQAEIDREISRLPVGTVADPVKVQEVKETAVRTAQLINGGAIVLGLAFLGCAVMVKAKPVPATITALSLYIGSAAVFGMIDPALLTTGWPMKIIVTLALVKAVQAAIAYQKEEAAAPGA